MDGGLCSHFPFYGSHDARAQHRDLSFSGVRPPYDTLTVSDLGGVFWDSLYLPGNVALALVGRSRAQTRFSRARARHTAAPLRSSSA
jgi:hypothetical protein